MIEGLFLINKPVGITSHDVVDRLRRITGERRIGHAGTLDPLASGLMLVAIGKRYTTQLQRYVGLSKEYEAEITLGYVSTTYDAEGELSAVSDKEPRLDEVEDTLKGFIGRQEQTPPIFSAKKLQGRKAYELARAGEQIKIEPKKIEVFDIKLLNYGYPKIQFRTKVSSGTYIRSLAHDIGQELGVGAYLSGLVRTRIGRHRLSRAIDLNKIRSAEDIIDRGINSI